MSPKLLLLGQKQNVTKGFLPRPSLQGRDEREQGPPGGQGDLLLPSGQSPVGPSPRLQVLWETYRGLGYSGSCPASGDPVECSQVTSLDTCLVGGSLYQAKGFPPE